MKKTIEPYYVLNWNVNKKDVEYYDIMHYLIDTLKEEKARKYKVFCDSKKPETFDEYKKFILNASRYQFWSRCQYEIVVTGFPPQDKEVKIDIYDQIEHNIDVITNHFIKFVINGK